MKLALPVAVALVLGCGDVTGAGPFALDLSVAPHAIASGDTATIAMRVANVSPLIQEVQFYCQNPFFVINAQGDTVVGGGLRHVICIPEGPPPVPLVPFDTLLLTYRWKGTGDQNQGGITITGPLPAGLYRVVSGLGGLEWPADTVRIRP